MEKDLRTVKNILTFFLVIVILYICKSLSTVILPLLLASFIALLLYPLLKFFQRKKIPSVLSLFLTVFFPIPFISLIIQAIRLTALRFFSRSEELGVMLHQKFSEQGIDMAVIRDYMDELTSEVQFGDLLSSLGTQVTQVVGSSITVVIYLVFILAGLLTYKDYFAKIEGVYEGKWALAFEQIKTSIAVYIRVKFLMSLALGLCIWLLCVLFKVEFALFWGFLCFVLNFIPTIGSILASSVCIIFSYLYLSPLGVLTFAGLHFAIQTAIGNVIEPIFLDSKLSINPLVIIVGLFFWGYMFGVIGALLSVPLVVLFKIIASKTQVMENWAKILDSSKDDA